jgi:hypothetical protein
LLRGAEGYLLFLALDFVLLLVVFFETGFLAAAMVDLLSWVKTTEPGAS